MANAATIVTERVNEGTPGAVISIIVLLIGLGYGAEWLFRRAIFGARGERAELTAAPDQDRSPLILVLSEAASLLVFALASVGLFLAFEWPHLLRQIVLTYLLAFIVFRVVVALGSVLLARSADPERGLDDQGQRLIPVSSEEANFWARRLKLFTGYFLFGWATVSLMPLLGFSAMWSGWRPTCLIWDFSQWEWRSVWRRPGAGAGR